MSRREERRAKRIVVADDNKALRELIGAALEKHGYEVVLASDGERALREIERGRRRDVGVALLIADVSMPKLGALALLARVSALPRPVPVIVIDSFMTPEERAEAKGLGAAAVFSKPFDLTKLVQAVRLVTSSTTNA